MVKSKNLQKLNICIVTFPLLSRSGSYYTIINNFLRILSPLVNEIFLITGNFSDDMGFDSKIRILDVNTHQKEGNIFYKTISQIIAQIKISLLLIRICKHFDGPAFMLSGTLLLPTITAKFLRKTSVLTAVASGSTNTRMIYKTATFYKRYYYYLSERVLELLTFNAATYIGVESPNVALFMNLPLNKVIGNGHLFFMDGNFRQTHNFANRPYCIGYVGRLSREKGVFNFVTALPDITLRCPDLHVTITGDGSLYSEIKTFLEQNELYKRVDFPGWISHDALPNYLNQLRLLVLPSYTEGLPNIMLEAMSCGTPVLATSVGAIPDVIIDGKNGFIMENNSPECIVENVIRALNFPDLEQIAENGKRFVEENFSFEKTVENWREILQNIE
ncbi:MULTISPECIES: glycosyltransferase family 4 protein [Methanosarcina]|uniref:Glycosyl transferase, group 1 family protein n=1 Tax=Methanosarcina barkeri MS TaxID=1434108 RepID=A0A0E3QTE2_METBA|nr:MULTISPECIES: glycosyltransferase family 4 protein [Methanosarcina]AKB53793.1 Glycosyl transferase, group 1 family protein [Methanosarcina barkeri MS]